MLRELRIENLILVEKLVVTFERGFNVLTGETGSGKSAIIGALRLIVGERADPQWIRRGASKAVVEVLFDIDGESPLVEILDEAGVQWDEAGLVIRREVGSRSRAFINNQAATLHLLRQLQPYLIHLVDQHANHALLQRDSHRAIVDIYGECRPLQEKFRAALDTERAMEAELGELKGREAERLRELEVCRREVSELADANLQEGEEEELFAEFSRLSNAESLTQLSKQLCEAVSDGVVGQLKRSRGAAARLAELDPSQEETRKTLESLMMELEEVGYTLRNYRTSINHNPERLSYLDERLSLINKIKRKYGETVEEVHAYHEKQHQRLEVLENGDQRIEELEEALKAASVATEEAAKGLSERRRATSEELQEKLTQEIRPLNMPQAVVRIEVTPTSRSINGDDQITLQLAPNVGERFVALGEGVSGGEIARLMLAVKTLLAGKERVGTLIFDELDANIGGETASVVGEKLTAIAHERQLLCITHFAQVAAPAEHHLQICKEEHDGRTLTTVHPLTEEARKGELSRMLGGQSFNVVMEALV